MHFLKYGILSLALAVSTYLSAGASDLDSIESRLEQALAQRNAAHQLAEAARALGESDAHHTIQYAKQQWALHNATVTALERQRQEAYRPRESAGLFRISYFCPCSICNGSSHGITASGAPLAVGQTIAVDPSVIPLGTEVFIDGIGTRIAQDTGSAIKGARIDVLVSDHEQAYRRGIDHRSVFVYKN